MANSKAGLGLLPALVVIAAALGCIDVGTIHSRPQPTGAGGSTSADGANVGCDVTCPSSTCTSTETATKTLVSGLEYRCGYIEPIDGRNGYWSTYDNGDSIVSPAPGATFIPSCLGAEGSCHSACISGRIKGDNYPYAQMGFNFTDPVGPYDLSDYRAASFYVSGHIGTTSQIRFQIGLAADSDPGRGGTCVSSCNDSYQFTIPTFDSPTWMEMEVPFSGLTQLGFGAPEPWDPTTALGMIWSVVAAPGYAVVSGDDFTLCVDEVRLVPK